MLVSYTWLQEHFKDPLPPVEELVDVLTLNAYEIEEYNAVGADTVIDVDVLPNRSHDSLCHAGIAREIATLLDRKYNDITHGDAPKSVPEENGLVVTIEDEFQCKRYIGRKVVKIKNGTSPEWLQARLEALGQRSINAVVDITNYVMLETGQPMHAFDADKLADGNLFVRFAKNGETMTTLDNQHLELDESMLVIADSNDVLALAGIKGGNKAEVDENTKSIVLEAANFNPTTTRKTGRKVAIQTDSSKRFENEITPELADRGIRMASTLVAKYCGGDFFDAVDAYPRKAQPYTVGVSVAEVNELLGSDMTEQALESVLDKLGFSYEKVQPIEKVIEASESVVGSEYKRPSEMRYDAPTAFSCSSLISYVFVQGGIAMPSLAIDKYVYGEQVLKKDLQPGDVVFVNTKEGTKGKAPVIYYESVEWMAGTKVPEGVDHAGIYMGDGNVLHTSWKTGKAVIEKLDTATQFQHVTGYRRFITNNAQRHVITIPDERIDLRITADIIEEIGRIWGYDNIQNKVFDATNVQVNKEFYYENMLRNALQDLAYSEIVTYAFTKKGDVAIANPIAKDKGYLRKNLFRGFEVSVDMNFKNAELLGLDMVRVFEIGTTFTKGGEKRVLGLGVRMTKMYTGDDKKQIKHDPANALKTTLETVSHVLGAEVTGDITKFASNDGVFMEIDLTALFKNLSVPHDYADSLSGDMQTATYQPFSPYPFMTRDVAVFVPTETKQTVIENILKEHCGELLVREPTLFDVFSKTFGDGSKKTSYAYRLVFQSNKRTLTDKEVNEIMDGVYAELSRQKGWVIR